MRTIGLRRVAFMIGTAVCALLLLAPAAGRAQNAQTSAQTTAPDLAGALAFLQGVYRSYEKSESPEEDYLSEANVPKYFAPALAKLIFHDFAESKKCDCIVNLDFDPFINAQDWTKTKIDVKVAPGAAADRATGTARFVIPGTKTETIVTLDLLKTPAGWRIADIRWSDEPKTSFVKILSKKS